MQAMALHRTQLLLENWHYEYLKNTAEKEDKSISEILREVLSKYIGSPSKEHLEEIAGIGADEEVSGRDHDRWLYRKSS